MVILSSPTIPASSDRNFRQIADMMEEGAGTGSGGGGGRAGGWCRA